MEKHIRTFLIFQILVTFCSAQTNVSGIISTNTTWTKAQSPYLVTNSINVSSGVTLTIEPGVSIKFNQGNSLQIDGSIIAKGTLQDSIIFTSNSNAATPGDWGNIQFTGSSISASFDNFGNYISGSILQYCKVQYGGNSNYAITINGNGIVISPFISKCSVQNNLGGISVTDGSPLISDCKINNCSTGIFITGQSYVSSPNIVNNLISNNTYSGIYCSGGLNNFNIIKNIIIANNYGINYMLSGGWVGRIDSNKILKNTLGLNIGNGPNSFSISNNIIADNLSQAISSTMGGNFSLRSNQIIGNGKNSNTSFHDTHLGYSNLGITFINNTFSKNMSNKNLLLFDNAPSTIIDSSNFTYNSSFCIYNNNNSGTNLRASKNWWGTNVDSLIQVKIYDWNDNNTKGIVNYIPYLTSPSITAPISPTANVKKQTSGNSVVVSWSPNLESNALGYKIYYKNFTGYSFQNVIDIGNVTSYTLPINVSISDTIAVTSYNSNYSGNNDQINGFESWYSLANKAPDLPANLTSDSAARIVKLNWTASVSAGVNNYNIYRSTDAVIFTKIGSSVNTNYIDQSLTPATRYFYKVSAFDSLDLSYDNYGLESSLTAAVSATPNKIIYITTSGNNVNIGSYANPKVTITNAIAYATTGDSILIGDGTYLDNINLNNKTINFLSINGADKVVLKPQLQGTSIVNISNASNTLFKGISFANVTSNNAGATVYFTSSSPSFESCVFRNNAGTLGVIATDAGTFTMNNCIAYANTSNQFFYISTSIPSPATINHFTYSNNSGNFLRSSLPGNLININNSIIWNTTNLSYTGTITIQNSIVKGGFTGNTSNLIFSPGFIDSAKNDFHLVTYSPAIALGLSNTGVTLDYEGNSRALPNGSKPDAGAFESLFGQSAPYIDSSSSQDGILTINWTQRQLSATDSFTIYKDTSSLPTSIYKTISKLVPFLKDSSNTLFNTPFYFRMTSKSVSGFNSGFSNIFKSIIYAPSKLLLPTDKTTKTDTSLRFTWSKVPNATIYRIQIANDSLFSSLFKTQTLTDTILLVSALSYNKTYYWRIRTEDSVRSSRWADFSSFQTKVPVPEISSIASSNSKIDLQFTLLSTLNIRKINIYRDTALLPLILKDTALVSKLTYSDSVANQIKYYYRITSVNMQNVESDFSNTVSGVGLISPILDSPLTNATRIILLPTFGWKSNSFASKYQCQLDTSNLFTSPLKRDSTVSSNKLSTVLTLLSNTNYYWRVRSGDNNGWSDWSNSFKFQTLILPVQLATIAAGNKRDTLKWIKTTDGLIKSYRIYRDTIPVPFIVLNSVAGNSLTFIDTSSLALDKKYYYSIRSINNDNVESEMSNIQSVTPFNRKPFPAPLLSKTFDNTGEFNTVRVIYSASGSKDLDGTITGYKWYVNDSLVNQSDTILIYYYKQGLNDIRLEITDNDGAVSVSTAQVKMSAFVKKFAGGILGGITALNDGTLYTADSTYDGAKGASVYKIDRTGNTVYQLIVSSKIFTTPSVSSDSSVFITSGSSLNGFNTSGAPLWSTIPLGGLSLVTPTIDSVQKRLYVGVSNGNFFAIDYSTGKVIWNVICDAPINSSAIITADRKLVFASDNGTLYGFDLRTISGQPTANWKYTVPEKISKSPAVDSLNYLYFGTVSGKLMKLKLDTNGIVKTIWSTSLDTSIQSSPVIDSKGFIYTGTSGGKLYKLNPDNGKVIWYYTSKGAIKSTPTISDYGNIYVADKLGYITSLSEDGIVNWKYQDSSAISSNLLWLNNMTYVGTEGGRLIGFYDNPNSNTVNTTLGYNLHKSSNISHISSLASVNIINNFNNLAKLIDAIYLSPPSVIDASIPVWGTFQGNARRTGSKTIDCPDKPTVTVIGNTIICTGDSLQMTTSAANKFNWIYNGTILINYPNATRINVSQSGKYAVIAFGNKGCSVTSDTVLVEAKNSPVKAVINSLASDATICFRDSTILKSSNYYDKYIWSTGDTLQSIKVTSSNKISLKGLSNGSPCYSLLSSQVTVINNKNVIPSISQGTTSSLISTTSSYYKWFLNNLPSVGVNGSIYLNPTQGIYRVETSLDNYCWDSSQDYAVIVNNNPLLNDTVTLTTYPNPSPGSFNILAKFQRVTNVVTKILITDISAKVVYQSQKLLFFSNTILIPINLGTLKGTFVVNMDINGSVKTVIVIVN